MSTLKQAALELLDAVDGKGESYSFRLPAELGKYAEDLAKVVTRTGKPSEFFVNAVIKEILFYKEQFDSLNNVFGGATNTSSTLHTANTQQKSPAGATTELQGS
ncbi:hypothetical protein [Acinetobacter thermotolerans]|uniref:hypothetical protein n=1 Tax=Acinetobacter thermotolerans TaxID=3151487 RepID=UPI00325ABACB